MYLFLSINAKACLRTFMAGLFGMCLVYFLWRISMWLVPAVVILVHGIYAFSQIGVVLSFRKAGRQTLVVRNAFHRETLVAPLKGRRWWCYGFDLSERGAGYAGLLPQAPNDLYVFCEVTDKDGSRVLFSEYIGFDTRFPNECEYAREVPPQNIPVFRIQRTDRLFRFLKKAGSFSVSSPADHI